MNLAALGDKSARQVVQFLSYGFFIDMQISACDDQAGVS